MMNRDGNFDHFIRLILIISVAHFICIFTNIGLPFGILYGPYLYMAHKRSIDQPVTRRIFRLHSLPFIFYAFFYLLLQYAVFFSEGWINTALLYYPFYFVAMIISLAVYPLRIFYENKRNTGGDAMKRYIVVQLCIFDLIIAPLIGVLAFKMIIWPEYEFGFNVSLLVYALLFAATLLMAGYLYKSRLQNSVSTADGSVDEQLKDHKYQGFVLDKKLLEKYAERLHSYLRESELYLSADLSLDVLSKETQIPKHHFSQLFNVFIGKSFYQIIAGYRIDYALRRISEDQNITIESLAYECGFNSKTSFNKYFKNQTGYTPSEYRFMRK